jgi:hypothetical protein
MHVYVLFVANRLMSRILHATCRPWLDKIDTVDDHRNG